MANANPIFEYADGDNVGGKSSWLILTLLTFKQAVFHFYGIWLILEKTIIGQIKSSWPGQSKFCTDQGN